MHSKCAGSLDNTCVSLKALYMEQYTTYFNPFTVPACTIPGLKIGHTPANSVFSGRITNLISILSVSMKIPSRAKKKINGLRI